MIGTGAMFRTHFYPEAATGFFLAAAAVYQLGWGRWMIEHGVPFDRVALAESPSRRVRITGRLLLTIGALCFAVAAASCFQARVDIMSWRLPRALFDIPFALGFLCLGIWSNCRLALCLRYLRTKASPQERSLVLSAVFYWLGAGVFFPLFGLNQILWLLPRVGG